MLRSPLPLVALSYLAFTAVHVVRLIMPNLPIPPACVNAIASGTPMKVRQHATERRRNANGGNSADFCTMRCFESTEQPVDPLSYSEQEVIKVAIAKAEANVEGEGVDAQLVVAVEVAEALAIALAQAMAEVFCEN